MPRVPQRRRLLTALVLLGALGAAGCANEHSGQLLLADVPTSQADAAELAIYAVDPGQEANADTRVTNKALSPLEITTTAQDSQVWINSLGRVWDGSVLLAYSDGASQLVTSGAPGEDATQIASSATTARTTVLRRGAFVQTAEGCILASSADAVDQVGTGNCAISLDERWVASWPFDGKGLTIRDLRKDSTETLDDLQVSNAGVLSADARVMAITRVDDGFQGVLIDATNGEVISRTDTYELLDVASIGADADGFVLQAGDTEGTELLYVDTEGELTTIEDGFYLVPLLNSSEVTYLSYREDLASSELRRWSPGDEESETLLTGYVGAGSPDGEHVIASKETPDGTEFWREEHGTGELTKVVTLGRTGADADPSAGSGSGIGVSQMQTQGSMVYLQVDGATTSSFVRIDTVGDRSDVPLSGAANLLFESLDVDGTALLTRGAGTDQQPSDEVLVVAPHDDEPEVRATLGRTATNLIHEGTIYLTDTTDPTKVTVSTLRSAGKDDEPTVEYTNKQIAGATWPQWGGATSSVFITPRLLLEQVQRSQQSAAAQSQQQSQP